MTRATLALIILTFIVMPILVGWQSDLLTPRVDALESRVATLEAWVFTPTSEIFATPIPATPVNTPTFEINNQRRVKNGSLIRNVRNCVGLDCTFQYAIQPGATFWICLTPFESGDLFNWATLNDGNKVTIGKGSNTQYVTLENVYRYEAGCE